MTFAELNEFVLKHTDAKYFDADVKLYKKHFPASRLIAELDRAPEFAKKALDERMIYELLNNQDSCIDCIWENRGYIRNAAAEVKELKKRPEKVDKPAKQGVVVVPAGDLAQIKHNALKKMVYDLNLQGECENHKKETYVKVLTKYRATSNEPDITDKKKEGQSSNIPE